MKWTDQRHLEPNRRTASFLRVLLALAGGAAFAWLSWNESPPQARDLIVVPAPAAEQLAPAEHQSFSNTVADASHDRRAKEGNAIRAPGGRFDPQPAALCRPEPRTPADRYSRGLASQSLIVSKGDQDIRIATAAPSDAAATTAHPNPRAPPRSCSHQ